MRVSDLELLELKAIHEARRSFWAYRRYINPKMKIGWWQYEIAAILQQFYEELAAGKRPKYIIQAPPQHGKSQQIVDFVSWVAGKSPALKTIYASYSERLGVRANMRLQRLYDSEKYSRVFPATHINASNAVTVSGQVLRNREILEYVGQEGFFRNTTVRGSITGESLDLGIVDDPIKGRAEANSLTIRDAAWEWFTDDFGTRFSDEAGMLMILTRWHLDDPAGRLQEADPTVKVFRYPAIAEEDDEHRKTGEALFPEHKSLDFLEGQKARMGSDNWDSLYQQNPRQRGGGLIKSAWFGRYRVLPKIKHRRIYVDTAQKTKEMNDYSVFECWGLGDDGYLYLLDVIRDKWEAPELRRRAQDFWRKHASATSYPLAKFGALQRLCIEDKSSGTGLIQEIKDLDDGRIPVAGIPRSTDKYSRAQDIVGYIESGYVRIPEDAAWVSDFTTECERFTGLGDTHDDQVDPMIDAIKDMLAGGKSIYDYL